MTEPSREAVDAMATRMRELDPGFNPEYDAAKDLIHELLEAALPIELEKARQRWEQEVRERLEALDWQAINSAAEAQCPSRDHRPLACAQCVTDAALSAIFGEAEPVEGER